MRKQPIKFFDADDLIMSTTSYYLGRMTAKVTDHCRRPRCVADSASVLEGASDAVQ